MSKTHREDDRGPAVVAILIVAAFFLGAMGAFGMGIRRYRQAIAERVEISALIRADAREINAFGVIANAYEYWYEGCQQRATTRSCALAAYAIKRRRDNFGGAAMYDQEPLFLEWKNLTMSTRSE